VRLASVTALLSLYSNPDNKPALQDFTARFQQRFGELFYDRDEAVAVKGVSEQPGRQVWREAGGRLMQGRQTATCLLCCCCAVPRSALLCFLASHTHSKTLPDQFSVLPPPPSAFFLPAGAAQHAAGAAQGGTALPVCSRVRAAG
jgi:hypothetical protein